MPESDVIREWIAKLEIRELIERSVRYIDDRDGAGLACLFADDGVLQLAGTVFAGRQAVAAMFGGTPPDARWTDPGGLLRQPATMHLTGNPVIEVVGASATAETDMVTLRRGEDSRARITLLARYRDRLRRTDEGVWLLSSRTGVSIAAPGEEGTDAEWARALSVMPAGTRSAFRVDG